MRCDLLARLAQRLALLFALALALVPAGARSEDPDDPGKGEALILPSAPGFVPVTGPWRPPAHAPDEKDWLRLDSGEWVRGTLEHIVDEMVYFDSDELDDLEIDWEDVSGFGSARHNTYRFHASGSEGAARIEGEIVTGTAAMREGVIRVDTGTEVREFPSEHLLSMIEGDLREINYWSLDLSLGLTMRSGNSDQTDTTGRLEIERETPLTELHLSYESAYSVVEDEEITNNQRATGHFSVYVSRRFFVLAPTAEAYRDRIQNIDLRATIGAGVGYDIVDRPRAEWNVVLGGGYQRTDFDDVEAGEDSTADDAAVLFGTDLELDPMKDVDWDTSYQLQWVVTDTDKSNHHLLSVLSVEVWGPLDLDVSFAWDRVEGPTRDADGELPRKNDFRLTVGLSLDL